MTTRADVVAEARTWLGTRFAHQCRARGVGVDCGGLIGGVAMALGIIQTAWWADVFDPAFGGYARQPSLGTLQRICDSFMQPTDDLLPGNVMLMRFAREPQHLAFVSELDGRATMIHSMGSIGRVVEHGLDFKWQRRIVQAYAMPGVGP